MLRRLYHDQPESFAFTPDNQKWAEAQITKYPEGRQASAIIPLLWRAQEQEGWLTRPAIEYVADMLGMAYIRALEVASFYFMFQLQPVGSVAHIQVCGTTSCMICGAEDLIGVCKEKIAATPHTLSDDGKLSWEEVECLGSCANAPMAQIGKDYYEDLSAERMGEIIEDLRRGEVPLPGPQNGRYASEPLSGLSSLKDHEEGRMDYNASVALAHEIGDSVKRIDGTEVPLLTPWLKDGDAPSDEKVAAKPRAAQNPAKAAAEKPATKAETKPKAGAKAKTEEKKTPTRKSVAEKKVARPKPSEERAAAPATTVDVVESAPETLAKPRAGGADDLQRINGVGPKLEGILNEMGFWHFDQIANWTASEIAWVDTRLKFKGRIERDDWVAQAKVFAAE